MKLDVPRFDGADLDDWLFRIEAYFDYYGTPPDTRLQIVSFHLEGRAGAWFQWAKRNDLFFNWPSFITAVKHRFDPNVYEDYEGNLSKLT
uniref:Retrotransposon gag domain-containing protein n=1 Tax=Cajanus cajan TaxID=3821 RepID=A0A151RTQ8_CAJCA|nr:hypothetical protein KK1_032488 [Cajanus cajan]